MPGDAPADRPACAWNTVRKSMSRTPFIAALAVTIATAVGFAVLESPAQPPATSPGSVQPASQSIPAPVGQPPMDPGAQLLADARASFTRVKDYMGTLVKEERVGGKLQPEQYIMMRVRQQPFSVYLKWTG